MRTFDDAEKTKEIVRKKRYVWKLFRQDHAGLGALYFTYQFKKGENHPDEWRMKAYGPDTKDTLGFHVMLDKKEARAFQKAYSKVWNERIILKALRLRKGDILFTGTTDVTGGLIAKTAIISTVRL